MSLHICSSSALPKLLTTSFRIESTQQTLWAAQRWLNYYYLQQILTYVCSRSIYTGKLQWRLRSLAPRVFAQPSERHWPCERIPHVTHGFYSQRASNAENDSIWWRHHDSQDDFFALVFPFLCVFGAFKSVHKLLNLKALQLWTVYKNDIFLHIFIQNIFAIPGKMCILFTGKNWRALGFKSSYAFLKLPPLLTSHLAP